MWRPSIDERPRFVRPRFVRRPTCVATFHRREAALRQAALRQAALRQARGCCRGAADARASVEVATGPVPARAGDRGWGVLRRRIAAATDPPLALLGPSDAALEMVRACLLKLRLASRGSRSPVTRVSATGSPDGSSLSLLRSPPCGGGEARMWHALIRTACPCAQTHACTSCH